MNEYDSFENAFQASIPNKKNWAIPKLFIALKDFTAHFTETFVPKFSVLSVGSVF